MFYTNKNNKIAIFVIFFNSPYYKDTENCLEKYYVLDLNILKHTFVIKKLQFDNGFTKLTYYIK